MLQTGSRKKTKHPHRLKVFKRSSDTRIHEQLWLNTSNNTNLQIALGRQATSF